MTEQDENAVNSVMVIGGGIAGIEAALNLADFGFHVYLVEDTPSIGGLMARLDKTFPTNDCSICIEAPKMYEVQKHPNIELLSNCEVRRVKGKAGNFKVRIQKKPRFVDEEKCKGCGKCAEVCPVTIPEETGINIYKLAELGLIKLIEEYENGGFNNLVKERAKIRRDGHLTRN
ncbi:MAG: CoB--CoM heterodisulfide reductase iron-sulfur subunit A family protein [Thermoplasmata archaeon]|nr:MAG: CoB--CoM heterodisulfide reductase iron-sulfur subunit A family protein [Thermoplasmata archaeon]